MNHRDIAAHETLVNMADARLEQHIAECAKRVERLIGAGSVEQARIASRQMASLIAMRSPEQVRRMEKRRGLA